MFSCRLVRVYAGKNGSRDNAELTLGTVGDRWANIGGIVRYVLASEEIYQVYLQSLALVPAVELDWSKTNVWSVGNFAKLFMCPEPGPKATIEGMQWKFLSLKRAEAFCSLLRS